MSYIALEHRWTFRTWSKVKWPLQVGKKRILKDTRKKGGPWQINFQVMPPRFRMTLLKSTYQPLMSSLSLHLRHLQLFKRPTIPVLQRWPCVVWIDRWLVKGWCRFCTMRRCPGLGSRVLMWLMCYVLPAVHLRSRHLDRPKYDFVYLPWAMRKALQYWIGVLRQKVSSNSFCAATATRRVISFAVDLFLRFINFEDHTACMEFFEALQQQTRAFAAWPQHVTGCTLATGTVYITIFHGTYPIAKTYWNIETVSSESFQFSEIVWTGELLGLGLLSGLVLMFGTSVQRHCRAEAGLGIIGIRLSTRKRSTRTGPNLEDTVAKRGTGDPCVALCCRVFIQIEIIGGMNIKYMKHHYSYGDVMSSFGQSTSVDPIATSTDSANLCHACECIEEFFMLAMLPWSLIKAGWLVSAGNLKQRCIWSLYCRWLQSLKWEWNQARRCVTYIWLKCTTGLPAGPITTSTFLWLLIVKQISKYWMHVKVLLKCVQMIKCLKRWQTLTTKSVAVPDFRRKAMWLVASGGSRASRPFGAAWGASAPQTALAWVQCVDAFSVWWCYVLCENASKSESCCIFGVCEETKAWRQPVRHSRYSGVLVCSLEW